MSLLLLLGDTDSNPRSLFASGEQGGYYDPSVANTLFQLSDGVTAATQPGDPVGLIIDSRKGGLSNLGSDLVTNGTFAADSDWTKGANWTIGSGVATKTGGAANNLTQTIASTAGAWYRLTMDVTRTAGTLTVSLGTSGTTYAISATETYTFMILAGSSTQTLTLAGDSSFAGTVDNVVARNVPGNHLYQPVSGSRGTLSREPDGGKRNLLTYTEDLSNAVWTKGGGISISYNNETGPGGQQNGTTVSSGSINRTINVTNGATYTFSFWVKAGTSTTAFTGVYDLGAAAWASYTCAIVDGPGSVSGTTGTTISGLSTTIWTRVRVTWTAATGNNHWLYMYPEVGGGWTGKTNVFSQAQLETGSTATAYQKNTTQYDCTEAGKRDCFSIDFDGSDDSYFTSSTGVDFSATDKMTVWAGVWKRSDAVRGVIFEHTANTTSNSGGFTINLPDSVLSNIGWRVAASSGNLNTLLYSPGSAPLSLVAAATADISADALYLRINGIQQASDTVTDLGGGNFANAVFYVGRRGNATLPFSGRLYGLIIRGVATTDAKVREYERYVARIIGRAI